MKKFFGRIFGEVFFRHSAVIFASSIFTNIANLVFWLYMVRKLSPEDYGSFNSLISVMMLFSVPLGILQTVITRYVSKFMAHDRQDDVRSLVFYFSKALMAFVLVVLAVLVLFGRQVSLFLQMQNAGLIYLIGFGLVFTSLSAIAMGSLYGLQKFNDIASNIVITGLTKLVAGFSLVALGFRVAGAILGFIASFAASFAFALAQLPSWLKRPFPARSENLLDKKDIFKYFIPAGLSMLSLFLLTNADIILVKHYFTPLEAGYYSVAQMVGKIVLFVPGAIGVVMFPKIVENHAKNMDTIAVLKRCLSAVGVLCGIATVLSLLFPETILKILTGHSHPQALSLVKFFALSMSFFALVNILALYHLSLHNMKYIILLCVVSLSQVAAICLFHSTLDQVLSILFISSAFLLASGLWLAKKEKV
ncbi:MAG TPA: hypothetical protein DCL35_02270 [Candidatus Omnitrophica bacterium]|nr:hypothetical protein [Candidatus Omnitrophota bacterium]